MRTRIDTRKAALALIETAERTARESPSAVSTLALQPSDFKGWPLLKRELRVYYIAEKRQDPYATAYNGRGIYLESADYLYCDWRRDDFGWVDFDVERDEALGVLCESLAVAS